MCFLLTMGASPVLALEGPAGRHQALSLRPTETVMLAGNHYASELNCPGRPAGSSSPDVRAMVLPQDLASWRQAMAEGIPLTPQVAAPLPRQGESQGLVSAGTSDRWTQYRIAIWGDSHTASGDFAQALLQSYQIPPERALPSVLAPTFSHPAVRQPLRRYCLTGAWQSDWAWRSPKAGAAFDRTLARLTSTAPDDLLAMDFRYPSVGTRVRELDVLYRLPSASAYTLVAVAADDGPWRSIRLSAHPKGRLRIQSDGPLSTLRIRSVMGTVAIEALRPTYWHRPQVVLDVFSVPGATAAGWGRLDSASAPDTPAGRPEQEWVVLAYGTNEAVETPLPQQRYAASVRTMVTQIRRAYPRARCILMGPPDSLRDAGRAAAAHALVARIQREEAERAGCRFFDAQKAMGGEGSARKWQSLGWMSNDGVHLTAKGYRELAARFAQSFPLKAAW